jgi:ipoprotein LpqH
VVKRGIVVGLAVVAVVAGSAGCSDKKSDTGASSSPAAAAPAGPQVTVDGQKLDIKGAVTCTVDGDNTKIGIGDASDGIGAVISNADPPIVHAVGLGNVGGITYGFSDAAPGQGANAGAAKKDKSIAIKGTATGADVSDPANPKTVTKPFEMSVTCP